MLSLALIKGINVQPIEYRVSDLEKRIEKLIADIAGIHDAMIERRRQADKTQEVLEQIQISLAEIQHTISSVQGFIDGVTKTIVVAVAVLSTIAAFVSEFIGNLLTGGHQ